MLSTLLSVLLIVQIFIINVNADTLDITKNSKASIIETLSTELSVILTKKDTATNGKYFKIAEKNVSTRTYQYNCDIKGINNWKAENLKDLQDTIYDKAKNKLESDYLYDSPIIVTNCYDAVTNKEVTTFKFKLKYRTTIAQDNYAKQQAKNIANYVNNNLPKTGQPAEYLKLKVLYEYFVKNFNYCNVKHSYTHNKTDANNLCATPYGVFKNKYGVCQGFTQAFSMVCKELGIPCWYCLGYYGSSFQHHSWNIVKLKESYYYLDVTNDISAKSTTFKSFLISPTYKAKNGKIEVFTNHYIDKNANLFRFQDKLDSICVNSTYSYIPSYSLRNVLTFSTYNSIEVSWTADTTLFNYIKVYVKPSNSSNYIEYGTYNASSGKMIIQNNSKITLKPKTTYYIKLVAYNSSNKSETTEVISSKLK